MLFFKIIFVTNIYFYPSLILLFYIFEESIYFCSFSFVEFYFLVSIFSAHIFDLRLHQTVQFCDMLEKQSNKSKKPGARVRTPKVIINNERRYGNGKLGNAKDQSKSTR